MSATLVDDVKARAADPGPDLDAVPALPPVPSGRYADAGFAALEQAHVFGRCWLLAAHVDELPEPGDYRTVDHLPQPVVLVRDHDGTTIRAFYNTCQHRGAALFDPGSGHTGRRMVCPYHSWAYDLDGRLAGLPDAAAFGELDRDCVALTAVRCETWGPLVFVNLDPDGTASLRDHLGTVADDLSELADLAGRLHLVDRPTLDVDVNWKLPVDANIETYHVNTIHRDSAAKAIDQSRTGIQLLRNGHSRMLIRLHDGRDLAGLFPFPPVFDGVGDLPDSGTFSYHVFPNLSIVFSSRGYLFFITNWPTGPASSSYHVHFCSSWPNDAEHEETNRLFLEANRSVLLEDLSVLPGMQRSIGSGTLRRVTLGRHERRIYHLHEAIDRAIGVERIPPDLRVEPVLADLVEA